MFFKGDIRGTPNCTLWNTVLKKHNKGGASHQKEIEKWIKSFERFLSLHKLTS